MHTDTTRLSIDVEKDLYKLIKHTATFEDKTIRDFVIDAIRERLESQLPENQKEFNELTRITLEKAEHGEDLHEYKSLNDFINAMSEDA
jgi:uncharacterized protein (DUF1778 family)